MAYDGEYLNDKKNGYGKYYKFIDYDYNSDFILVFEGEYLEGNRWNGKGKEYDEPNKIFFEGEYFKGRRWNGIFFNIFRSKTYEIKFGKGYGIEYMRYYSYILDGIDYFIIYEGEYENGLKNGKGIEYKKFDSDEEYLRLDLQKAFYEGEFLNGKKMEKEKNILFMEI